MAQWRNKVPDTSDEPGVGPDGISVGGRDVPVGTPHFDPKKALAAHGIQLTAKVDLTVDDLKEYGGEKNPEQNERKKYWLTKVADVQFGPMTSTSEGVDKSATVQGDVATPAVEGLTMPGFGYARVPKQKPLTEDQAKRPPRVVLHGAPPNATYPHPPIEPHAPLEKDESDDEPTTEWQSGRPRWMCSPGYSGPTPQYASQKPGPEGNQDTMFSKNIMQNPQDVHPVDPDAFYIW